MPTPTPPNNTDTGRTVQLPNGTVLTGKAAQDYGRQPTPPAPPAVVGATGAAPSSDPSKQPTTGAVDTTQKTPASYTIKAGDTLSAIAAANGTNIQAIMKANPGIKNPNQIRAGGALTLPGAPVGTPAPGTPNKYQNDLHKAISAVPDTSNVAAVTKAAAAVSYPGQELPPEASVTVDSLVATLAKSLGDILSPTTHEKTLTEDYTQTAKDLGIEELNTKLMNMENVINGTPDDIRAEVTKAGGFMSESQVLALAATRNKTLINQANMLQQQLTYKQSQLATLSDLDAKDRDIASKKVEMATNLTTSLIQIQQKMQDSAADGYNKIVTQAGYTGLAQALKGDPYSQALAEKALRLPAGTLSNPAALKGLETYRQQSLAQGATRINIQAGNQQSLADYRDARTISTYATAVNSIIKTKYPTNKNPLQLYNNSAQVINRIDEAYKLSTDPKSKDKTAPDLDLIDAYVSIARGGQNITEAQVDTLLKGLGISAKWDVATQKVTGTATLNNGTRKSLYDLSHNIFAGQQQLANAAVVDINKDLAQRGFPQSSYLTSPDDYGTYQSLDNSAGQSTSYYNNEEYYQASDGNWYPKQ